MSYFIGYRAPVGHAPVYTSATLHEVFTASERAELHRSYDKVRKVSASEAHRWVKDGGLHGTALYIGVDGRIHRAIEEKD